MKQSTLERGQWYQVRERIKMWKGIRSVVVFKNMELIDIRDGGSCLMGEDKWVRSVDLMTYEGMSVEARKTTTWIVKRFYRHVTTGNIIKKIEPQASPRPFVIPKQTDAAAVPVPVATDDGGDSTEPSFLSTHQEALV
jgi:hypothetical protein